jgi:hypothetical protein
VHHLVRHLPVPLRVSLQTHRQRHIEKHPELWLWAYKHFRLKPENAAREYPFYAIANGEFEKMRDEI